MPKTVIVFNQKEKCENLLSIIAALRKKLDYANKKIIFYQKKALKWKKLFLNHKNEKNKIV